MNTPRRDTFLLLAGGQVHDCGREAPTADQLGKVVATCEVGGLWIARGLASAPATIVVPWVCEYFFCPRCRTRNPCPWWIDGRHIVRCALRPRIHPGPVLFEGPAGDPPMVLKTCRTQAATPLRLESGLMLETSP